MASDVQTGGNTYTLSNITATHTVAVSFKITDIHGYRLSRRQWFSCPVKRGCQDYDGSQLFTASPATGYEVDKWQLDGV